mmetsp:Transcript_9877/g.22578  ORF Transcript_9877/g.22578 Transcript_9877/m.22578 type:complete len:224 (+) Transcript_9877:519-1190(+)
MVVKLNLYGKEDIGNYIFLTNNYCILPYDISSKNYNIIKSELNNKIEIICTTISETNSIGNILVGNSKGLIVPNTITSQEQKEIVDFLPDNVLIKKSSDNLTNLGNYLCNDEVIGLCNPELSTSTYELISDVLGIEIFKLTLGNEKMIGTFSKFNKNGGIVYPLISTEDQNELVEITGVPFIAGTVNSGCMTVGKGIVCNDKFIFCGYKTNQTELHVIKNIFE